MPTLWYVTRDGRTMRGPFTSEKLKELAGRGHLLPTDTLKKEKTLKAGRVRGLFHLSSDGHGAGTPAPETAP